MSMYDGAENDIQAIARYIVEDYKEYDDGDCMPKGWYCLHCCSNNSTIKTIYLMRQIVHI